MGEETTLRAIHASLAEGPAWHGPAVLPLLEDLNAADAAAKPVPAAHSVWEILLHMNAWQEYAVRALQHQEEGELEGEKDWPPIGEPTEENWKNSIARFKKTNQKLRSLLDDYDNQALRENVPGRDYSMKVLLHGVAHHNAYHAGQIGLLKQALKTKT